MRRKIIMFVLNNIINDSRVLKEAYSLSNNGFEVCIIGIYYGKVTKDESLSGIIIKRINILTKRLIGKIPLSGILIYFETYIKLFFTIPKIGQNIVYHGHDLDAAFPLLMIGKVFRKKVVYDSHELFTEMSGKRRNITNRIWKIIERKTLNSYYEVIATNKYRAEIMKREYGLGHMPIVVENMPEKYSGYNSISNKYKQFVLNNEKISLYQGGINEHRAIDKLIDSVKYFTSGEVILIIMGQLNTAGKYVKQIQDEGLGRKVILYPAVPNYRLSEYTVCADVGIVIYKNNSRNNYYCASTKMFEYLAAGLPICCVDFPPLRKFINQYKVGTLFNPDKPKEIAESVYKVLNNYDYYKENINKLIPLLKNEFIWRNEGEKLVQIYEKAFKNIKLKG